MFDQANPYWCRVSMVRLMLCVASIACPAFVWAQSEDAAFNQLDTNEDGVLSGKEAKSVLQFDADGDGEVTKAEYLAGMKAERKRLLSMDDKKLFAERDGNQDEVLSGTEVRGFEKYDADGDGEVTWKEFQTGRAAERGVSDPAEMARRAHEEFRRLDANEDGRLSGKEMIGYEKLDRDGDGRITEKEFITGFAEIAPSTDPVTAFLEMIQTADSTAFLTTVDPEFAKVLDRPVVTFIMQRLKEKLGSLEPAARNALKPTQKMTTTQQIMTFYQGQLPFEKGKADGTLVVDKGRIVGLQIESPALTDVNEALHLALLNDFDFSRSTADFYTPRCTEFLRLILESEDDKAFSKYHPEAQKLIGREKVQNVFEVFRAGCGKFKGVELEALDVQFDEKGKGESIKLTLLVRGTKHNYFGKTTLQFIGMSAHITGLEVEPTDVKSKEDTPDSPPKANVKPKPPTP